MSSLAARVGRSVTDVLTSARSLSGLLEAMRDVLARLASGVRGRLPGTDRAGTGPGIVQRYLDDAAAADLNRFPRGEAIRTYSASIPAKPGWYDVGLHGSPDRAFLEHADGSTVAIDHRTLADLIRRQPDYDGSPIRLLSCSTGRDVDGLAQRLADALGTEVEAPSDTLWIWSNGATGIGPTQRNLTGEWRMFHPRAGGKSS